MATPSPRKKRKTYPFRLTGANTRLSVLEILANFGVATRDQITRLHFGTETPTQSNFRQIRQATHDLERAGYIRYLSWFKRVYGLTAKGVKEANAREFTDPYELSPEKSLEVLEHELKRTEAHAAIEALAQNQWALRWRKTDLYRHVEPDDLFLLSSTPFFFELENHKKNLKDLYLKAKRYFDYVDTERCYKDWGFRKPYVLFQFPNEERMRNFLDYLTGKCNCTYYRGAIRHTCLKELRKPPITTKNFLVTCEPIFPHQLFSAADYEKRSYSFSDLVG